MPREYKNILRTRDEAIGQERRRNIAKEPLKDSTPFPNPLEYKDIDEEFKRWVEEDLDISFEGSRLPTITLFSNQRFSEYMQSWASVDDKKNLLLNFKTITRQNNPQGGTTWGDTRNIPGKHYVLLQRVERQDDTGRSYYVDYKMLQPFAIDLIYTISIVTNKYEMLNEFNQLVNEKFKAIDCYIRPQGHFIPMKLTEISDESEYSIDNRQFYSQSYNITVMAYIITKDSFVVEEKPRLVLLGYDGDRSKSSYAEVEEFPCDYTEKAPYAYEPITITMHFDKCDSSYKFKMDSDFTAKHVLLENVRSYKIFINDTETIIDNNFKVKINDEIKVKGLKKINPYKDAEIKIDGFCPFNVIKKEN